MFPTTPPPRRIGGRQVLLATAAMVAVLTLASLPGMALAGSPGSQAVVDTDRDGLADVFEDTWAITSPTDNDSDNDGLRDSAEDADNDGLSNLGEQRYGTSPTSKDTDGDGIRDGSEDSDGDGIRDTMEQDDRRVPAHLVPTLGQARLDLPANYSNGCHTTSYASAIHPCLSGDATGTVRITIFGDSHALQWLPALERIAPSRHWRIVAITKSACPSVDVTFQEPVFTGALSSCLTWRARGERWIRSHPQDLVIFANSRGYRLTDAAGALIPKARRELEWQHAVGRTLRAMPDGPKLLVLGDVPVPKVNVPLCLRAHPDSIAACVRSRRASVVNDYDDAERTAAAANGGTFGSLARVVCSYRSVSGRGRQAAAVARWQPPHRDLRAPAGAIAAHHHRGGAARRGVGHGDRPDPNCASWHGPSYAASSARRSRSTRPAACLDAGARDHPRRGRHPAPGVARPAALPLPRCRDRLGVQRPRTGPRQ